MEADIQRAYNRVNRIHDISDVRAVEGETLMMELPIVVFRGAPCLLMRVFVLRMEKEEIKVAPTSQQELRRLIRLRIGARKGRKSISLQDQTDLAAILINEVQGIWLEMSKPTDDPFLDHTQNSELQRRVCVHVVCVCEYLFLHYIKKVQGMNARNVYSVAANIARLKAQLTLDATKFMNVLMIRRHLVADIRDAAERARRRAQRVRDAASGVGGGGAVAGVNVGAESPSPKTRRRGGGMSVSALVAQSRPKSADQDSLDGLSLDAEMSDLSRLFPSLDLEKVQAVMASLPERRPTPPPPDSKLDDTVKKDDVFDRLFDSGADVQDFTIRPTRSMPDLSTETLMDELCRDGEERYVPRPSSPLVRCGLQSERPSNAAVAGRSAREDLNALREVAQMRAITANDATTRSSIQAVNETDELPPLLKAIAEYSNDERERAGKVRDAQEKSKQDFAAGESDRQRILNEIEEQKKRIKTLQPDTVPHTANGHTFLLSGPRLTPRESQWSMGMHKFEPIFNEINDEEMDEEMVRHLDRALYMKEEIREVYVEMLRTVPRDHIKIDQDPLFVVCPKKPNAVSMRSTHCSSTHNKRKHERILNTEIVSPAHKAAPWPARHRRDWSKLPLPLQPDTGTIPVHADLHSVDAYIKQFNELKESDDPDDQITFKRAQDNLGTLLHNNKSYASWLGWWCNTITTEDFLRFAALRGSDHLGAVFHLYDSDNEEEQLERELASKEQSEQAMAAKRERDAKLKELRAVKNEFQPGMWNANSIWMGGLGKDPEIEERKMKRERTEVEVEREKRNSRTLRARIAARADHLRTSRSVTSMDGEADVIDLVEMRKREREALERLSPQQRLERIWNKLKMPDKMRLDMAVKYSSEAFAETLVEALRVWERALLLILDRELLVASLESFERIASDPNRFFDFGDERTTTAGNRLTEEAHRKRLNNQIEAVDAKLTRVLQLSASKYGDAVSFQGRPYADKMHWDRIEMLYWLGEERKQHAIKREAAIGDWLPSRDSAGGGAASPLPSTRGDIMMKSASSHHNF